MWTILVKAVQMALTAAGGWAISDIWNEYQTRKQLQAVSAPQSAQATVRSNWMKWVAIAVGTLIAFVGIAYLLPLFIATKLKKQLL